MIHVLVVYDRRAGRLVRQQEFPSSAEALQARFAAEDELGINSRIEIVALSGASMEDLRLTHGRYFLSDDELRERLVGAFEDLS